MTVTKILFVAFLAASVLNATIDAIKPDSGPCAPVNICEVTE